MAMKEKVEKVCFRWRISFYKATKGYVFKRKGEKQ